MDLTRGQQRLVFLVVVLALVGLGIYLLKGRGSGGTPAAAPATSSSSTPASAATGASSAPPATVPAATPSSTLGGAEIYQWLPFSPADLAAAARTTTTFAKDYATWSYTETAAQYANTMTGLVTAAELTSLQSGYATPGEAGQRTANKQVSTGSGTIDLIRSFAANPTSITFLVTINQRVTSTQPTSTAANQYAVTVVPSGNAWLVSDIELSKLGNSGIS